MQTKEQFLAEQKKNKVEDAQAELNWLEYSAKESASSKVKPNKVDVEGLITNISAVIEKAGKQFRIVTVGGANGGEFIIPQSLFLTNAAILSVGTSVLITCEKRVAGVTGYEDAQGKWQLHTGQGGLAFTKAAFSDGAAQKVAERRDKALDLKETNAAKSDSIQNVIAMISRELGDDTAAKGTAFAGAFAALR